MDLDRSPAGHGVWTTKPVPLPGRRLQPFEESFTLKRSSSLRVTERRLRRRTEVLRGPLSETTKRDLRRKGHVCWWCTRRGRI